MKTIVLLLIVFVNTCRCWEYCQSEIQSKLCGKENHFICNSKNTISEPSHISKTFLAHVPLTRKVKTSFLNWHNYYRNRTAGGWTKNLKNNITFPKAIRMRELIWDSELSYLSHVRTKLVSGGEVSCRSTQRFPHVGQNLKVKALSDRKPVLEIIALSLREMFNEKNNIENPTEMPKTYLKKNQFTTIVNDQVSRLGCAVALGANCVDKYVTKLRDVGVTAFLKLLYKHTFRKGNAHEFCYYTACTYDDDNKGIIYKIGVPTGKCSRWESGRSKTYIYLCANSGKIFER